MSFHYNADNSHLLVNGKKFFKFKAGNKIVNSPNQFCLGIISNGFSNTESREISLNVNVYDFSFDYNGCLPYIVKASKPTKCLFLNDESCTVGPTFIDLNPVKLTYYPFMTSLDKRSGSCNVLSPKMYVPEEAKDINVKAFNVIICKNETKKKRQKIFHYIANVNLIVQHITQIRNVIIKHVNMNVKIIVDAKTIIVGILANVFVRITNIKKVLLIFQWSSVMKL